MAEIDWSETFAGAICYLAAAAHSKSVHEQQQFAASFFADCQNGFMGTTITDHTSAILTEMIAKAGKAK